MAMGSGEVPVLATPRVVALMEEATVASLEGHLEEGVTSVGMRVNVDHLAPTRVGVEVTAEALLEQVDGRRLTFSTSATAGDETVATGSVTRVVVDTDRFLGRVG